MNVSEPPIEDDYETQEEADARQILNAAGQAVITLPADNPNETITEYGAFNQAEFFEPLFASGEIHAALRTLVDEPQFTSNNLRSAVRFCDMRNSERALDDKMGVYGPMVVRTQTVTKTPWRDVSYEDIDRVRGR